MICAHKNGNVNKYLEFYVNVKMKVKKKKKII